MKKLRVGVIGCGRISVRHFLPIKAIEDSLEGDMAMPEGAVDEYTTTTNDKIFTQTTLWKISTCYAQ